jgi:V8-like Glu-specific endopeptidase
VKVVVEIVAGARAGRRLEFDDPQVVRFGRHPSNEVAFDPDGDRDASSRHAELRREGDALYMYDLGSANGTRVGKKAIASRAQLEPGAEIEFGAGGPRCRISWQGAQAATVPPTVFKNAAAVVPAGTKVGARTVAMMIDQAMSRVRAGSRRQQVLSIALGVALLFTLAGVVVAYRVRPPGDVALKREMVRVMEQQLAASAGERAELQKKLDALSEKLRGSAGSEIARANHDSVFLVTVKTASDEQGFCTAFAVQPDMLVTNAHCVAAAEDYRKRAGAIWVVQNGHPERRLPIERMKRIQGFSPSGGISPDVGWLKLADRALSSTVKLAARDEYQAIATGDTMYTYGFPGRLADVGAPEATFVEGVVGRVTTLDGRAGAAAETKLLQHSAFTSGGTSGSPIFDGTGHVVAVNTGGYAESTPGNDVVTRSLPGYNFGMRVDLVEELLSEAQ